MISAPLDLTPSNPRLRQKLVGWKRSRVSLAGGEKVQPRLCMSSRVCELSGQQAVSHMNSLMNSKIKAYFMLIYRHDLSRNDNTRVPIASNLTVMLQFSCSHQEWHDTTFSSNLFFRKETLWRCYRLPNLAFWAYYSFRNEKVELQQLQLLRLIASPAGRASENSRCVAIEENSSISGKKIPRRHNEVTSLNTLISSHSHY